MSQVDWLCSSGRPLCGRYWHATVVVPALPGEYDSPDGSSNGNERRGSRDSTFDVQRSALSFRGELPISDVQCPPPLERARDATTTKALARWIRLNDPLPISPRDHEDPLQEPAYYSHRSAHLTPL